MHVVVSILVYKADIEEKNYPVPETDQSIPRPPRQIYQRLGSTAKVLGHEEGSVS
jgi:hypothetical protein